MNRRPRLGLAGAGAWGQNLLRLAASSARADLVAVIDPDERARDRARQAARALGRDVQVFHTLHGARAARLDLDALLIASPARTHGALAAEALEAGLDILVEKPLTTSAVEAAALVELARRRGRIAMVGHLLRYHPGIRRLLDEVRRGTVGEPRGLLSSRRSPPGRPTDVPALWALGPHDASILLAVDASPLSSLRVRLTDEEATLHARTEAGLTVRFWLSRSHPTKERRLLLLGQDAALVFDDLRSPALSLHRATDHGFAPEGEPLRVDQAEPLALEFEHFLDCIRDRHPGLTPATDGLQVVRWLEAAASGRLPRPGDVAARLASDFPASLSLHDPGE